LVGSFIVDFLKDELQKPALLVIFCLFGRISHNSIVISKKSSRKRFAMRVSEKTFLKYLS
jgi:hypothetical protein